jgi:hypothetical protein
VAGLLGFIAYFAALVLARVTTQIKSQNHRTMQLCTLFTFKKKISVVVNTRASF